MSGDFLGSNHGYGPGLEGKLEMMEPTAWEGAGSLYPMDMYDVLGASVIHGGIVEKRFGEGMIPFCHHLLGG
jgi:hypothetical protein